MTEPSLTVVGSIVLDLIRSENDDTCREVRFGGVCLNAAVGARREIGAVTFVSTGYQGEVHQMVEGSLARRGLRWHPVEAVAPVPLFEVRVVSGEATETFEGTLAFESLSADDVADACPARDAVLTCTDLSPAQLAALLPRFGTSFVLASSAETAPLLERLSPRPDYLGLNRHELEHVRGQRLSSFDDIARAVPGLVGPAGHALVTLGGEGALLVSVERRAYVHQPVSGGLPSRDHWIGAGDVLFGSFAGALVRGESHQDALARGVVSAGSFTDVVARSDRYDATDVSGLMERASGWRAFG